jgi:hypothetical protein
MGHGGVPCTYSIISLIGSAPGPTDRRRTGCTTATSAAWIPRAEAIQLQLGEGDRPCICTGVPGLLALKGWELEAWKWNPLSHSLTHCSQQLTPCFWHGICKVAFQENLSKKERFPGTQNKCNHAAVPNTEVQENKHRVS